MDDESVISEDDDLIGDLPPAKRRRGRPTRAESQAKAAEAQVNLEQALRVSQARTKGQSSLGDPYAIQAGVNATWLSQAFRMDIKTVRRKLASITPIGVAARGAEVYDFAQAASYLAKPPPDTLATFLRGLRVQDLPIQLQDPYWSAMRKKQIYELHARQLWKTEDVLEVLGETAKAIKSAVQLWIDNLDAQGVIGVEQRPHLERMVDALLEDIHIRLVEMPKFRQTGSLADAPESHPEAAHPDDEDPVG